MLTSTPAPGIIEIYMSWLCALPGGRLLLAAAFVGVFLAGSPAQASPGGAEGPSAADKDTARRLMDQGDELLAAGELARALDTYRAADDIMGVPSTAVALAGVQEKLGLLLEARDNALRAGRYPQRPDEPEAYAAAREQARQLAGRVELRLPSVRITVVGPPGGEVELRVDGQAVSAQGLEIDRRLDPGSHRIAASAPGFVAAEQTLELAEGARESLRFELKVAEGPSVESPAGPTAGIPAWTWVGFGMGGAGLVVGAITGGLSLGRVADLETACPERRCGPERQPDIDAMNALANASNVGFAVGGAGVGLGIVGLVVAAASDGADAAEGARATPVVGPIFVGARGSF